MKITNFFLVLKNNDNHLLSSFFTTYTMCNKKNKEIEDEEENLKYFINNYGYCIDTLNAEYCDKSDIMLLINEKCERLKNLSIYLERTNEEHFKGLFTKSPLTSLVLTWDSKNPLPETLVESLKITAKTLEQLQLKRTYSYGFYLPASFEQVRTFLKIQLKYISFNFIFNKYFFVTGSFQMCKFKNIKI